MERFDYDYLQEPRQPEWDWWFIYGGEDDTALPLRCGSEDDPRVIRSPNRHSGEPRQLTMARCDGAPRELLDFDDDRRRAADIARIRWTSWQDHLKGLPSPKPLSEITENYKRLVRVAKEEIQPPYQEYANQPAIKELAGKVPVLGVTGADADPVAHFGFPLEVYVQRMIARVVPTDAVLTLEGRWINLPDEGDPYEYFRMVDNYIENLSGENVVLRLLYHH
ncbi:hypothetical protein OG216_08905 [Streptomycetaceae bacterium NBC_01309]